MDAERAEESSVLLDGTLMGAWPDLPYQAWGLIMLDWTGHQCGAGSSGTAKPESRGRRPSVLMTGARSVGWKVPSNGRIRNLGLLVQAGHLEDPDARDDDTTCAVLGSMRNLFRPVPNHLAPNTIGELPSS